MNTPAPPFFPDRRRGASLVLAIIVVATLVSLALGASTVVRMRLRAADSVVQRATLRVEARGALLSVLVALSADTNGVTHLGERWALDSAKAAEALSEGRQGTFVRVDDALSRLPFPACGPRALAALLAACASVPGGDAAALAGAVFSGIGTTTETGARTGAESGAVKRQEHREGGETAACAAAECLADLAPQPEMRSPLEAAIPFLSVHSDGKINPNTVGREAFTAAAIGAGALPGAAEGLWRRLERVRARGGFFASLSPVDAMRLVQGDDAAIPEAELAALRALLPFLAVDSDVFCVRAVARRGGADAMCECVWQRGGGGRGAGAGPEPALPGSVAGGRILEWRER